MVWSLRYAVALFSCLTLSNPIKFVYQSGKMRWLSGFCILQDEFSSFYASQCILCIQILVIYQKHWLNEADYAFWCIFVRLTGEAGCDIVLKK